MHCRLIVPGLFWPGDDAAAAYRELELPALQRLLARGRKSVQHDHSYESWLIEQFVTGPAPDDEHDRTHAAPPIAAYSALADGLDAAAGYWLRADPVHLLVDRDSIGLIDAERLPLTPTESTRMIDALNAHFAADGLQWSLGAPTRWYVRIAEPVAMSTRTLSAVRGRAIEAFMPTGPDARRWSTRLTETQMLLHGLPVNDEREARGERPINSVWWWGGGMLATAASGKTLKSDAITADEPIARGMGLALGRSAQPLPVSATALISSEGGVHDIVLDQARTAADYLDLDAWRAAVETIERNWIAPLVEALRDRRIGMLTLVAFGADEVLSVELIAGDLRAFWRRSRSIDRYLHATRS